MSQAQKPTPPYARYRQLPQATQVQDVPFQEAALDTFYQKYALRNDQGAAIDTGMEDAFERIAQALANQEPRNKRQWKEAFLWALRMGATPAGRIIANAGAAQHKPQTALINCTVSETIEDSMAGIMGRCYDAAITLKGGAGIGYCFSTLRPRGSFVAGDGSTTSGPMSFMDIYDKMCFTVSSAGGRRGAQMATFHIAHPDVLDFIRAKREQGRLRQFNLSVLVPDDFIEALDADALWPLVFPLRHAELEFDSIDLDDPDQVIYRDWPFHEPDYIVAEDGRVACKVYQRIPARRLWDLLMNATYDYAEPGIIFIDRVNEQNNNWFCEQIEATNPCVSKRAWVMTEQGPQQVWELARTPSYLRVHGQAYPSGAEGFFMTGHQKLYRLETEQGYTLELTGEHPVYALDPEPHWCPAWKLTPGTRIQLHSHTKEACLSRWPGWGRADQGRTEAERAISMLDWAFIERTSSEFYRGFLSRLLARHGLEVSKADQASHWLGLGVRDQAAAEAIQRMLLRMGIWSDRGERGDQVWIPESQAPLLHAWALHADAKSNTAIHEAVERRAEQVPFPSQEDYWATFSGLIEQDVEPVYDVQVDEIHAFDANGLMVHNCGEQALPPGGSCLLGSVNLTRFVREPFSAQAHFDWERFDEVVRIFTRMLDNVVDINGLPLEIQRHELLEKRRHGMGFTGLGSAMTMLRMRYGDPDSVAFTEAVTKRLSLIGWQTGLELAQEKGPAPVFERQYRVSSEMLASRPEMAKDGYQVGDTVSARVLWGRYSRYMRRIGQEDPELLEALITHGARFTHHSSIAPTGTISLSLGNNASNGIEPSFAHQYQRNLTETGRKTRRAVDVFSYELLAYRHLVDPEASAQSGLPDYFITAEDISPKQHVAVQAAAQKWVDSSISKTINVPTEHPYEDFKAIYRYAYSQGLKGCTTFRFNPEHFSGVLVREEDLQSTIYEFTLDDGQVLRCRGDEEIEYDGEIHTAANLYDALKEGYYGRF